MNAPFRLNTETIWTDERVERLTKLWTEGSSASQIAATLGGMTRSAVIGKIHRLGMSQSDQPPRPPPQQRKRRNIQDPNAAPRTFYDGALNPDEGFSFRCGLLELTDATCRFPLGEPGESSFFFCGAEPEFEGQPYCGFHDRICHAPPLSRRVK